MKQHSEATKPLRNTPLGSIFKLRKGQDQYCTPSPFHNKENCDPQPNICVSPEGFTKSSPKDLPDVICDLSHALEISNNTVQSLKNQLETVLQREATLQIEHEMLYQRYENLSLIRSQTEAQCKERDAKETALREETERKMEELKEIIKQKNKMVEMKNLEIAEFSKKLHGIRQEHNNEVTALNDEIMELKSEVQRGENKQMKEKGKFEQITKKVAELKSINEKLEETVKEKDEMLEKYESKIKVLETETVENENQQRTISDLQKSLRNAKAENDSLKRTASELKKAYDEKKEELIEIKEKSGRIQQRIEELRKIESDLRGEYNTVHTEKKELQDKCKELEEQVKKLQNANKKKEYETEAQLAGIKEQYEASMAKYKDELNKIALEKERLAVEIQNYSFSKQKIEDERRKYDIEITQWKEAILELATLTIKSDHHKIQNILNISDKYKMEPRLSNVSRTIQLCKDIIESQDDTPESVYMLKEALRGEKAKYLELHKRYHAELVRRRKLHNFLQELKGNIRVMCRVRPLLYHEVKRFGSKSASEWIQIPEECMITAANEEANKISSYEFDRVFAPKEGQDIVFEEVQPMVVSAMDGYNVAILAYGQTGSGKTYTMEGNTGNEGVTFRALQEVFAVAKERADTYRYEFAITIVEVYNEKVRNLLDKRADKLDIMENSAGKLKVVGLVAQRIASVHEAIKLFEIGKANRSVGVTNVNEYSSRSHCVLSVYIKGVNLELKQKIKAKLDLVDLAGSERLSKSEAEGERMKEATNINLSLTTLGKVLNSLAAKSAHIPYRDSKLTHLLKSSIGGDAKTLMIVQVSPNPGDVQESLSTLSFGARVCGVEKGKAKKNATKLGRK